MHFKYGLIGTGMMTIRTYTLLVTAMLLLAMPKEVVPGNAMRKLFCLNARFIKAAEIGDIATVQAMVADASQEDKDDALIRAASEGQLTVVLFLLGMNINGHQLAWNQIADIYDSRAEAFRRASANGHQEVVQFLSGTPVDGHELALPLSYAVGYRWCCFTYGKRFFARR